MMLGMHADALANGIPAAPYNAVGQSAVLNTPVAQPAQAQGSATASNGNVLTAWGAIFVALIFAYFLLTPVDGV